MLTPEQRFARRLGGSTIAAALGVSRWKSPLDAYLEVRHEAPEVESSEDIDRGVFLEPSLLQWAKKKTGIEWVKPEMPIVSPLNQWFTFSPDGLSPDGREVLEIKAPHPRTRDDWGDEGSADVPIEYLLQGAWGVAITGAAGCHFAALIDGKLKLFRYVRDLDLELKLLSRASAFITEHVIPGKPPAPTYLDEENVRRIYPRDVLPRREWSSLNAAQQQIVADFVRLHAATAKASKELESLSVLVTDIIGDHSGITKLPPELGLDRIDWRAAKPSMHAGSWKSLAEELMQPLTAEQRSALLQRHLPAQGSRRLTVWAEKAAKKKVTR